MWHSNTDTTTPDVRFDTRVSRAGVRFDIILVKVVKDVPWITTVAVILHVALAGVLHDALRVQDVLPEHLQDDHHDIINDKMILTFWLSSWLLVALPGASSSLIMGMMSLCRLLRILIYKVIIIIIIVIIIIINIIIIIIIVIIIMRILIYKSRLWNWRSLLFHGS